MKKSLREIVLRGRISTFGRLAIPAHGSRNVSRRSQTIFVKVGQIHLGTGVSGLCPALELTEGFLQVPPDAAATEVQDAEVIKRQRIAAFRRTVQPVQGRPRVHFGSPAGKISNRQINLGGGRSVSPIAQKRGDRKSTRLNSSHVEISYAVFCLKK